MAQMEKHGGARLNSGQFDRLTKEAFIFPAGQGAGCPDPVVNKALIGKDASVLAKAAGVNVPDNTQILFAETGKDHVFVKEEQMMPFLPIVRVKSIEEGIEASLVADLAEREGQVVHREELLKELWGFVQTPFTRSVDTAVARLRKKIESDAHRPRFIHTVHGDGYCLTPNGQPL
jgi:hypothetical protein